MEIKEKELCDIYNKIKISFAFFLSLNTDDSSKTPSFSGIQVFK